MIKRPDHSLGDGVYYAADDYVSLRWRIMILMLDAAVLFIVYVCLVLISLATGTSDSDAFGVFYLLFTWAYLTAVKRSRVGTLGYWVMRAEIVDLHGRRPSLLQLTFRLLLWVLGPFNFLFDLMWAASMTIGRPFAQVAGTCVIRRHARPLGTAEVHLAYYSVLGIMLAYPRVARRRAQGA